MTTYNIIIAGVGGQGVITASSLLAQATIASGLDVRMYGSYGMSQRGGSVSAQLRIGPRVLNARMEKGEADLILCLDLIEAVRWAPFLAEGGRLITTGALLPPAGKVIRDGGARHLEFLKSILGTVVLDAEKLSGPAGSRGVNAVLLGAASAVKDFPVTAPALEGSIREQFGSGAGPVLAAFIKGAEALK
jgi:indolepyruvate ferredoxin oxidoreductase beta subunit